MILAVDLLADKYKMLPSQVIREASTFDLYVLDTATKFRSRQEGIAQVGAAVPTPHMSQEEMLAIVKRHREQEQKNELSNEA